LNRRTRFLAALSGVIGITLLLAWIAVQSFIIRPAIEERERLRTQQVLDAAALIRSGVAKEKIERSRGIDLRLYHGPFEGPPKGGGWLRSKAAAGSVWRREGGEFEIAAWTGHTWVAIQEHQPVAFTLILALIAAGVPAFILTLGLTRQASRRQIRADETLAKIAAGNLRERMDEQRGSKETRRLASSVNRMAIQLQALIRSDRQRMAGLSHELRTPLTRIRLELELARREGGSNARLHRIEKDIEVFDSMLTEMLELSRLQLVGRQQMKREAVDLEGLVQLVLEEAGWSDVEIRGAGVATVDASLVARLVRNVLRNSLQHAPSARRWVEIGEGLLEVGDDGPGMPLNQQESAVKPFARGQYSTGHGLGLAIVAEIAALHGASVSLSTPPGLVVSVRFPE